MKVSVLVNSAHSNDGEFLELVPISAFPSATPHGFGSAAREISWDVVVDYLDSFFVVKLTMESHNHFVDDSGDTDHDSQ
jgi:hypothetical protein